MHCFALDVICDAECFEEILSELLLDADPLVSYGDFEVALVGFLLGEAEEDAPSVSVLDRVRDEVDQDLSDAEFVRFHVEYLLVGGWVLQLRDDDVLFVAGERLHHYLGFGEKVDDVEVV